MVIEYNFSIPTGSYLSKRLRFLKSTGLPLGLMQHMVRMYIRETPNSPTILLALNTDNGGAVTCAQDTFYPGSYGSYLFYNKTTNNQYVYRFKLPNGPWVFSPDGIIQLWAGAAQTAEAFGSLKEVFYDLEIVPVKKATLYGVRGSMRNYQLVDLNPTTATGVELQLGDGNADDESDVRITLVNSGTDDKLGYLILPCRHEGYLQYCERGGVIQIVNMSSDSDDNVVPYADTVPRRVLGAGTNYLTVTPAWPTIPAESIACKAIYTAPPIQIASAANAAVGYERMPSSIFIDDPEGSSTLITNGTFASDLSGWVMITSGFTVTQADGKALLSYSVEDLGSGYASFEQPISPGTSDTRYATSFTVSNFTGAPSISGTVRVILHGSDSNVYSSAHYTLSNKTYNIMTNLPDGIYATKFYLIFSTSMVGPIIDAFNLDDVVCMAATGNVVTLTTDWAHDSTNYCITKTASANVDPVLTQEVLTEDDGGKVMRLRILVGDDPTNTPADPFDTRMAAVRHGTLTVAINNQSWVLGTAPYAWTQANIDIDFVVNGGQLSTSAKRSVSLTPSSDFDGAVFCLMVRELPSYGSADIDADNGNDQCEIEVTNKVFLIRQVEGNAASEILQEGDVIFITDLRVDRGESTDATKVGLRYIDSVSDSKIVCSPKMSEGEYDDETGVTDLVITKVDQNLAEQFVRGKISLIGPNVTREAEAWR